MVIPYYLVSFLVLLRLIYFKKYFTQLSHLTSKGGLFQITYTAITGSRHFLEFSLYLNTNVVNLCKCFLGT